MTFSPFVSRSVCGVTRQHQGGRTRLLLPPPLVVVRLQIASITSVLENYGGLQVKGGLSLCHHRLVCPYWATNWPLQMCILYDK